MRQPAIPAFAGKAVPNTSPKDDRKVGHDMKSQAGLAAALMILLAGGASAHELEPVMPDRIVVAFPAVPREQRTVEVSAPRGQPIRVSFVCGSVSGAVELLQRREDWVPVGALLDLEYDRPCSDDVSITVLFQKWPTTDFDPVVKTLRLDFTNGVYGGWMWDGDNGLPLPPKASRPGS